MPNYLGEYGIIKKMQIIHLHDCWNLSAPKKPLELYTYNQYATDVAGFRLKNPVKYNQFKQILKYTL